MSDDLSYGRRSWFCSDSYNGMSVSPEFFAVTHYECAKRKRVTWEDECFRGVTDLREVKLSSREWKGLTEAEWKDVLLSLVMRAYHLPVSAVKPITWEKVNPRMVGCGKAVVEKPLTHWVKTLRMLYKYMKNNGVTIDSIALKEYEVFGVDSVQLVKVDKKQLDKASCWGKLNK